MSMVIKQVAVQCALRTLGHRASTVRKVVEVAGLPHKKATKLGVLVDAAAELRAGFAAGGAGGR